MSEGTASAAISELTPDEKAYAGLAHALMISTWWIGPLVIFLTKRSSRFVSFHALQALLWQTIFTALYLCCMVAMVVLTFTLAALPRDKTAAAQIPVGLFLTVPVVWLTVVGGFAITLTLGILYCLKAMRGEWAGYPIIGRWATRIVGS